MIYLLLGIYLKGKRGWRAGSYLTHGATRANFSTGRQLGSLTKKNRILTRGAGLSVAHRAEGVRGAGDRWIKFNPTVTACLLPPAGESDASYSARAEKKWRRARVSHPEDYRRRRPALRASAGAVERGQPIFGLSNLRGPVC